MSGAAALYTPEVLALATGLADHPLTPDLHLAGRARAPVCGSSIEIALDCDDGRIARLGMKVHACAIGQASAALFARSAAGQSAADIKASLEQIEAWLADPAAVLPDWPGIEVIAAARAYPARHGAILLAWKAALAALPQSPSGR